MPPPAVAPTKSNLLKAKERLSVAREGYELLEQKRELLVAELMRIVAEAKELEEGVIRMTASAYEAARDAAVATGPDRAALAAHGAGEGFRAERGVEVAAGIAFRTLALEPVPPRPRLAATDAACDAAGAEFVRLAAALARLAALGAMARRLAREARRAQRRVNALEKLVIPGAGAEIAFIEAALEERERDAFFALKRLKAGRRG